MPQLVYVNIYVHPQTRYLTDTDLLKTIKHQTDATKLDLDRHVSLISMQESNTNCVAIPVRLRRSEHPTKPEIVAKAREVVDEWIAESPIKGLPFNHRELYTRATTFEALDIQPLEQYVNVRFEYAHIVLADLDLLLQIKRWVRRFPVDLDATPTPLDRVSPLCLSIRVFTFGPVPWTAWLIQDCACSTVDRWIEEYPRKGLPFDRKRLFNRA
ncbi:hypothetical protein N7468_001682 [Penicillium chermesinum]|uniref:Uncharacterized protein n=1 Tax=Penicillium chermesinum TaxID=63820 RepID=A0A9W9TYV7_9EURO|nr:uncharacterized protein N7468_001682 [Penicillium chermesinum]KAJ5246699.1 hypothetical protein N7468_001682 [Penicillium chermesinum]KAJ6144970.1 hypothetical protein N7470_008865 [Penicillium chermesinum]